jgi:hypothetical protein
MADGGDAHDVPGTRHGPVRHPAEGRDAFAGPATLPVPMQIRTIRRLALSLPEAEERETWQVPTFRVRGRIFAMLGDDARELWLKSTHDEQRALVATAPETFFVPPYVGPSGWVGVRFGRVDRGEFEELLTEAWRLTAPKRLVSAFDDGGGPPRP